MDFVDQGDDAVFVFSEFVFGVHQDQPALGGDFRAALEQAVGVTL